MKLNEYQQEAMKTCLPTSNNFSYMFLNLMGEVGEFSSKVAKSIRKNEITINQNKIENNSNPYNPETIKNNYNKIQELKLEAGDVLWQLSGLCSTLGWTLEEIAKMNLDKLSARNKAGTIIGNGDGITNR